MKRVVMIFGRGKQALEFGMDVEFIPRRGEYAEAKYGDKFLRGHVTSVAHSFSEDGNHYIEVRVK
jgi:hypothetical protein